jgi:hypothetical protein
MNVSSPGFTAFRKMGFIRSRTPGSAQGTSQSGVSITCESASWTVRPSTYGMARGMRAARRRRQARALTSVHAPQ